MKKIGFLLVIIINIIFIYKITLDDKVYFLALGDYIAMGVTNNNRINGGYNFYIKDYLKEVNKLEIYNDSFIDRNSRTTDLINSINNNYEIIFNDKNITIQNALIKADLITLSIGNNDLFYELKNTNTLESVDSILKDVDNLLKLIKKSTKETVIVNGFYYPVENSLVSYANKKLEELCYKYNFIYNDISYYSDSIYPTSDIYKKIGNDILEKIVINMVNKEF